MTAAAVVRAKEDKSAVAQCAEDDPRWEPLMALPCRLTVDLSVTGFTVAGFLGLGIGSVVSTGWAITRDVPLRVNGIVIGRGELESAGTRLAVRLTELA